MSGGVSLQGVAYPKGSLNNKNTSVDFEREPMIAELVAIVHDEYIQTATDVHNYISR